MFGWLWSRDSDIEHNYSRTSRHKSQHVAKSFNVSLKRAYEPTEEKNYVTNDAVYERLDCNAVPAMQNGTRNFC